jgi:hypothetical protein
MKTKTKVKGKKVITTTERELGKYEFACGGCNQVKQMSAYAIAQLASGHSLTFTCECKHKTNLEPFK